MYKKYCIAALLSISLLLSSCGKGSSSTQTAKSENPSASTTDAATNKSKPEEKEPQSGQTSTTTSFDKQVMDNLIEHSDYISKVRVQVANSSGIETNFIADYRGDLSTLNVVLPKSLSPGKEYIVFYHDDTDGRVTPTRGEESFIEIQDNNDQSLQYIEKKFPVPESVNPSTAKSSAQKTTKTSEGKTEKTTSGSSSEKSASSSSKEKSSSISKNKETNSKSTNSNSVSSKKQTSNSVGRE